jgi:ketosteroid isomerase-like protein
MRKFLHCRRSSTTFVAMSDVHDRLLDAMNAHDAEGFASLFAEDYRSAQPIHASRAFGGRAQVLANWSSVFDGVPDFAATLLASSQTESDQGIALWGEWDWHGRYADGSPFAMCGVTILVVRDGLIAEGRLYMEPVAQDGQDIDEAVQDLYRPSPPPSD